MADRALAIVAILLLFALLVIMPVLFLVTGHPLGGVL